MFLGSRVALATAYNLRTEGYHTTQIGINEAIASLVN